MHTCRLPRRPISACVGRFVSVNSSRDTFRVPSLSTFRLLHDRRASSYVSTLKNVIDQVRNSGPLQRVLTDRLSQQEVFSSPASGQSLLAAAALLPSPTTTQSLLETEAEVDPLALVKYDLEVLNESVRKTVSSDHPVLSCVARYFFDLSGKRFRPTVVLLMARATAVCRGLSYEEGLVDSQRRLAEITELIHTASIVHDDVIDVADTRRGRGSANSTFGNKVAVLGGDFLLARASIELARLRNCEVIELLSTVIEHLVQGEIMQMKASIDYPKLLPGLSSSFSDRHSFEFYARKTYLKTASLIARSSQAVALLGVHSPEVVKTAYEFGKHLGLAYQYVDDMLDYTGSTKTLGKPALSDLQQGLATAPVLYAQEEFPALTPLIQRQFSCTGDVEAALAMVQQSQGIQRTYNLAAHHSHLAAEALTFLPSSPARSALVSIVRRLLNRDR
mmetsp:Transcript_23643/g.38887  ORF Transcript_23643/g.38887 Transcript_23643/m.38887 type:complete len:448 (-) Transcript_23643:771-2114(-)